MALEPDKRPLDPVLAEALAEVRPTLEFNALLVLLR